MRLTPEELNARKRRNLWLALGLVAFIAVIFATTFLRMQQNLAERTAANRVLAPAAVVQP